MTDPLHDPGGLVIDPARLLRQQAALARLSALAVQERDLSAVLQHAVELAGEALPAGYVQLLELQPDGASLLLRAGAGWRPGAVGAVTVAAAPFTPAGYALRAQRPVIVPDLREARQFTAPEHLREHGIVSAMLVAIPGPDRHIGVLGAHSTAPRDFTPHEAEFLQAVASIVASAYAQAHHLQLWELLAGADEALAAAGDRETALHHVARLLVPLLADGCAFWVQQDDGLFTEVAAAPGRPFAEGSSLPRFRRNVGLPASHPAAVTMTTGRPVIAPDLAVARGPALAEDIPAVMALPLAVPGRVFGALTLLITQPERRFSAAARAVAGEIARRAALAVAHAQQDRQPAAGTAPRWLEAAIEQLPAGVVVVDVAGGTLLANRAAHRVAPAVVRAAGQWRAGGDPCADAVPLSPEVLVLHRALRGETAINKEVTLVAEDGKQTTLLLNAAPVRDGSGAIAGAVAVVQDITASRDLDRFREEFLELAAHELKTPLTVIKGQSQLLLRRQELGRIRLAERDIRSLAAISERTGYAADIINELFELSHLHSGQLELQPDEMDIAAMLRELVAQQQTLHPRRQFVLRSKRSITGRWDRERLEQAVNQVLDNAVKFSAEGSAIAVRVTTPPGAVRIAVHDEGIGIPPRDLPRIFERFVRGGNVNRGHAGLGIGLYLARLIVERHGGRIWARNGKQGGAVFSIELPGHSP